MTIIAIPISAMTSSNQMAAIHRKQAAQDVLVALSLANLCLLKIWRDLIYADAADRYWLPDPTIHSYLAVLINLAALTLVLYCVAAYAIRSDRLWVAVTGRLVFLIFLIFPGFYITNSLIHYADEQNIFYDNLTFIGFTIVLASSLFAYFTVKNLRGFVGFFQVVSLMFFPFAVVNVAQTVFVITSFSQRAAAAPTRYRPSIVTRHHQRVLWLLMDELDFRMTFIDRPNGVSLPEFDRLRNQSLFSHNSNSNALNTKEAIPSFLTQRIVEHAEPTGAANLKLTFRDARHPTDANFPTKANLISTAARRGARIAILGYYHPYCRLFRREVAYCRTFHSESYAWRSANDIQREVWQQLVGISPYRGRINAIITYRRQKELASRIAGDPSFDFVFMHTSVPHYPFIWEDGRFARWGESDDTYFGNLVLADRLLGAIRANMEREGLWDATAVLVTSDHEWRHIPESFGERTKKIPFLLKMPGQITHIDVTHEFSPAEVTRDILLDVQAEKLSTADDVARWLAVRAPGH